MPHRIPTRSDRTKTSGSLSWRWQAQAGLVVSLLAVCACSSEDGVDGEQGPPGESGPRGDAGVDGAPGARGSVGPRGNEGPAGPAGPSGDTLIVDGGAGQPDEAGPPGAPGEPGEPGDPGSPGQTLLFVGPGLELTIDAVSIDSDGVAGVDYTITDMAGRPLDREGVFTEGAVAPSFILSWLDEDDEGESLQYTAYTLQEQTSPDTGETELQSATDSDGDTVALGGGRYHYTLGTTIDTTGHADQTHTLGLYATREFRGLRYVANETFSFVPNGDDVTTTLDVVTTEACASCHTNVQAHGGARRGVQMCNLCHTQTNSIDPDTGETFDFHVMIHKIHMGANLPSVQAGDPYRIVGYRQSVHDYSEVHYPGDVAHCAGCHAGTQGDRWETRLSIRNCASCHDRTYYGEGDPPVGWTAHGGGPRSESECIVCHADDSISPVWERHQVAFADPNRPDIVLNLVAIEDTAPGDLPRVRFSVTLDGAPLDVIDTPMDRLRMLIAGPNTDYADYWSDDIHTAIECGAPPVVPCLERDGENFVYHTGTPIPEDAEGSYTVGMEGRVVIGEARHAAMNPMLPFAVTGGSPTARREIVTQAKCASCHQDLAAHGNNRRSAQYCTMCHNANLVLGDLEEGESGFEAHAGNFKDMIHRLHAQTHYPDALSNCAHCHAEGTATLPVSGILPSRAETQDCVEDAGVDEDTECANDAVAVRAVTLTPPESAACTSCHSAPATAVHAEVNTSLTTGAESCATCHGSGSSVDVEVAHQVGP